MQINSISNISFGLLKSQWYRNYEKKLIEQATKNGQKQQAEILAKRIGEKVPNGLLDIDAYSTKFILTQKTNGNAINYIIGETGDKDAIETLSELNQNLIQFQKDHGSAKIFSKREAESSPLRDVYSLTANNNLPRELKYQLSDKTIKYIEAILDDIKAGRNNPNITNLDKIGDIEKALARKIISYSYPDKK